MFNTIWSYAMAGQEAIRSAREASSAVCDEAGDVRTAGTRLGPGWLAGGGSERVGAACPGESCRGCGRGGRG